MAITVTILDTPINVTATLQVGGSLAPNTTYYIRVVAKSADTWRDGNGVMHSLPSTEISFTRSEEHTSELQSH